jgi:hypothetical protein
MAETANHVSRLTLENGDICEIEVSHSLFVDLAPRRTRVAIAIKRPRGDAEETMGIVIGESICSMADNFDRGVGRYQALTRAFIADPEHQLLSRVARRAIWARVIPVVKPAMQRARRDWLRRTAPRRAGKALDEAMKTIIHRLSEAPGLEVLSENPG